MSSSLWMCVSTGISAPLGGSRNRGEQTDLEEVSLLTSEEESGAVRISEDSVSALLITVK